LSFPNARIKSKIASLGISIGSNVDNCNNIIKEIEDKRLFEAPNLESTNKVQNTTDDDVASDIDSDFGLDHHAIIQHLTGDIVEDMLGTDGSLLMDFKPTPRHKKMISKHYYKKDL
jgi:hypothetical protein